MLGRMSLTFVIERSYNTPLVRTSVTRVLEQKMHSENAANAAKLPLLENGKMFGVVFVDGRQSWGAICETPPQSSILRRNRCRFNRPGECSG